MSCPRPPGTDALGPHPADVPLPQQPELGARGLVALVGLGVRPETRVVLPGGVCGRHGRRDLRRGKPRRLVARYPGDGLRGLAGGRAPEPGPRPCRDRLRAPVAGLVANRSGCLPVPLLHEPAIPVPGPRLLPRGTVARGVTPNVADRPPGGRGGGPRTPPAVAPPPAPLPAPVARGTGPPAASPP